MGIFASATAPSVSLHGAVLNYTQGLHLLYLFCEGSIWQHCDRTKYLKVKSMIYELFHRDVVIQ